MEKYEKNIIPHIEAVYGTLTPLEKVIADFFIRNPEEEDLSARNVSGRLFVSEASLSRFAKKCGYKGYREFVFRYQQRDLSQENSSASSHIKAVLGNYQDLLNKSYSLIDEEHIDRIVDILTSKKRIYVYGKGSSGLVGMEMKLRFMRIGLNIEAATDVHIMKMNSVLVDSDCAVIGISVGGRTEAVLDSLKTAKKCGATVILFTSRMDRAFLQTYDEVMLCAVKEHLEKGKAISPQFPILIMVDLIYSRMLRSDNLRREAIHEYTMEALKEK